MVQGSQEWLDARRGIVTASTIGKLLTPTLKIADNDTSRGLINTLAAERVTGEVEYVYPSFDMQRGTEYEPYARAEYEKLRGPVETLGFMRLDLEHVRIGYSPDGLVGDHGLLEIKSRKPRIQLETFIAGRVPAVNMAQVQTALLVSGRKWVDYCSFSPGMPLYIHRIEADTNWQNALLSAAHAAEERINQVVQLYNGITRGLPLTEPVPEFGEVELKL
jgi:hypothetical protein